MENIFLVLLLFIEAFVFRDRWYFRKKSDDKMTTTLTKDWCWPVLRTSNWTISFDWKKAQVSSGTLLKDRNQLFLSPVLFLKLQLSRGRKGFTIVNYGFTVLQFALFLLRFLCFNLTCVFAFLKDFVVCSFHNVCWYGRVATTQMAAPSWCSGHCQRN